MADLLFSFQGRANRAKWWLVALAIFVVEMIVFAALVGGADVGRGRIQLRVLEQRALEVPLGLVVRPGREP